MPIDVPTLAASCVSTAALGIVGIMLRRVEKKMDAKDAEKWYDAGLYNDEAMRNLVEKGCITAEAYERITGMAYEEVTV